jgi:hypothetical protein
LNFIHNVFILRCHLYNISSIKCDVTFHCEYSCGSIVRFRWYIHHHFRLIHRFCRLLLISFSHEYWKVTILTISAVSYAISWMRLFSLLQYHCTWLFDGNLRYVFNAGAGTAYPSGFVDRCLSEKIRRSSSYCVWRPKTTSSTICSSKIFRQIHL